MLTIENFIVLYSPVWSSNFFFCQRISKFWILQHCVPQTDPKKIFLSKNFLNITIKISCRLFKKYELRELLWTVVNLFEYVLCKPKKTTTNVNYCKLLWTVWIKKIWIVYSICEPLWTIWNDLQWFTIMYNILYIIFVNHCERRNWHRKKRYFWKKIV